MVTETSTVTETPSEGPAAPGSQCGTVTYPATGTVGTVVVQSGSITCSDAHSMITRYMTDPSIAHTGNTWSAQFDGWGCSSPTAAGSVAAGYSTQCMKGDVEVRVVL